MSTVPASGDYHDVFSRADYWHHGIRIAFVDPIRPVAIAPVGHILELVHGHARVLVYEFSHFGFGQTRIGDVVCMFRAQNQSDLSARANLIVVATIVPNTSMPVGTVVSMTV